MDRNSSPFLLSVENGQHSRNSGCRCRVFKLYALHVQLSRVLGVPAVRNFRGSILGRDREGSAGVFPQRERTEPVSQLRQQEWLDRLQHHRDRGRSRGQSVARHSFRGSDEVDARRFQHVRQAGWDRITECHLRRSGTVTCVSGATFSGTIEPACSREQSWICYVVTSRVSICDSAVSTASASNGSIPPP